MGLMIIVVGAILFILWLNHKVNEASSPRSTSEPSQPQIRGTEYIPVMLGRGVFRGCSCVVLVLLIFVLLGPRVGWLLMKGIEH